MIGAAAGLGGGLMGLPAAIGAEMKSGTIGSIMNNIGTYIGHGTFAAWALSRPISLDSGEYTSPEALGDHLIEKGESNIENLDALTERVEKLNAYKACIENDRSGPSNPAGIGRGVGSTCVHLLE